MSIEAMKQALQAIANSGDFLFNWHDCEPNNEREMSRYQEVLAMNEKAFTALRVAIASYSTAIHEWEQAAVPSAERGEAHKKQPCKYPKCPYPCLDLPDCKDAEDLYDLAVKADNGGQP